MSNELDRKILVYVLYLRMTKKFINYVYNIRTVIIMTVEDVRELGMEVFTVATTRKVENVPGFEFYTRKDSAYYYIINPLAKVSEVLNGIRKLEEIDRNEGYSVVADFGIILIDEKRNISVIHSPKVIPIIAMFSPSYLRKKKLYRKKDFIDLSKVVKEVSPLFNGTLIKDVKYKKVAGILIVDYGRIIVRFISGKPDVVMKKHN